jgi:hypothetical protein
MTVTSNAWTEITEAKDIRVKGRDMRPGAAVVFGQGDLILYLTPDAAQALHQQLGEHIAADSHKVARMPQGRARLRTVQPGE